MTVVFGWITGISAFFTFIWSAVLLGFQNKPGSSHPFTRIGFHLVSFYIFATWYFVTGVVLTSYIRWECDPRKYVPGESFPGCEIAAPTIAVNWIVYIFSMAAAVFIQTRTLFAPSDTGLKTNIADITFPPKLTSMT